MAASSSGGGGSPSRGAGRGPGHVGRWETLRQKLGGVTGPVVERRGGTVKPPSFHAPLALMCTHARGLLKAIQTAS